MWSIKILAALLFTAFLAGCAGDLPNNETAKTVRQPTDTVGNGRSRFTQALACVGDLLRDRGFQRVLVSSGPIKDPSQKIPGEFHRLVAAAIGDISRRSSAVMFIGMEKPGALNEKHSGSFGVTPHLHFDGAITEVDARVATGKETYGPALSFGNVLLDVGKAQAIELSSVGMTMRLVSSTSGAQTHSTRTHMIFSAKTGGFTAAAGIEGVGGFYEFETRSAIGAHAVVRTLIDLAVLELVGKLFQVPYWDCLSRPSADPQPAPPEAAALEEARGMLKQLGYLGEGGEQPVSAALQHFQLDNSLTPTGQLTTETLAALRKQASSDGASPPPLRVHTRLERRYDQLGRNVKLNERLQFSVVTNRTAFVYCFYEDKAYGVTRLSPTRWQPDAIVRPDAAMHMPPAGLKGTPTIVADQAGDWAFGCMATHTPIRHRYVDVHKTPDPLTILKRSLKDVFDELEASMPKTAGGKKAVRHIANFRVVGTRPRGEA